MRILNDAPSMNQNELGGHLTQKQVLQRTGSCITQPHRFHEAEDASEHETPNEKTTASKPYHKHGTRMYKSIFVAIETFYWLSWLVGCDRLMHDYSNEMVHVGDTDWKMVAHLIRPGAEEP
jgi:hypothetical protein